MKPCQSSKRRRAKQNLQERQQTRWDRKGDCRRTSRLKLRIRKSKKKRRRRKRRGAKGQPGEEVAVEAQVAEPAPRPGKRLLSRRLRRLLLLPKERLRSKSTRKSAGGGSDAAPRLFRKRSAHRKSQSPQSRRVHRLRQLKQQSRAPTLRLRMNRKRNGAGGNGVERSPFPARNRQQHPLGNSARMKRHRSRQL